MDDSALWERWKTGRDAEAFAEIVSRHAAMVHSVSRRVLGNSADAEDVAQECFLELLRARPAVRASLGALLHSLAIRRSLDRLKADVRRRSRERRATDRREAERPAEIDLQSGRAEREEILARVDEAIDELPDELRGPIVLRLLEGIPAGKAAAALDISESTLRFRIEKGVARVRSALRRRGIVAGEAALLTALGGEALVAAPRGLVSALGKIAISGGSLPQVPPAGSARAVLRPSALILTGAILMKKKILVIAAVILLLAGGVAYRALERGAPPPPGPSGPITALPPPGREASEPPATTATVEGEEIPARRIAPPPDDAGGRRIDILCIDGRGDPAVGAEVFLVERLPRQAGDEALPVSHGPRKADGAGLARFPGLSFQEGAWLVEVYARVPGLLAGITAMSIGEKEVEEGLEPLTVVLLPAARLQGVVLVPEDHDPTLVRVRVTGISVREASSPLGESLNAGAGGPIAGVFETRPGEDGAFAFDDIPTAATVRLEAVAPGLSRAASGAEPDWEHEVVEIRLVQEGAIAGVLRFADTGLPAEGVWILAQPLTGEGAFRAAVDAEGRFRIGGLPGGSYSLALAAPAEIGDWTLRIAGPFPVSPGESTSGIEILLERGGIVSGLVRDASSGAPVAGICIAAVGPAETGKRPLGAAFSDPEGRYSLRLPPGDSTLYVASDVPEYIYPRDQGRRTVKLESGAAMEGVDFGLEPRTALESPVELGRVRGRILDPGGRPLGRARVRTFTLHDPEKSYLGLYNRVVLTDDDGRYEAMVLAGPRVYVEAGGHLHSTASAEPFTVAKDEVRIVEDLSVRPAEGALEGHVFGPDGTPVEGAEVRAGSKSKPPEGEPARTDAAGRFRVDRLLEDEPIEITVVKEGSTPLRLEGLRAGTGNLRLVLEPLAEKAR